MKYVIVCLLFFTSIALANNNVVNVYNWAGYLPYSVIKKFEVQTGIHVNYETFQSNSSLYTKIKLDPHQYDVIVPSSYLVGTMRDQGMLHKLDFRKLPNVKNLFPFLLSKQYDPYPNYSLPYFWGTTGIAVNDKYYRASSIQTWNDLWQPRFHGQLLILDEAREAFDMALKSLGYSINDENPHHIHQAFIKLKRLLPNVKLFNEGSGDSVYADEDALVGMGFNADIYVAHSENSHVQYIYPKDGPILWVDDIAIPKYTPHLANAYKFINFIMQAKIAAQIAENIDYSTPNKKAYALLPKTTQENHILYPDITKLKHAEVESSLNQNADLLIQQDWQNLKLLG
jgi:spermidine/putrescine transport system substrate-binding protein